MSSSIPPVSTQAPDGIWQTVVHNAIPIAAASAAIVPVFGDFIRKSAEQQGLRVPSITFKEGCREGIRAAPTVGVIVGTQMVIQRLVEKALNGDSKSSNLSSTLASSAIVGAISSPFIAILNGQSMKKTIAQTFRNFSVKQAMAITVQETSFVAGICLADPVAKEMKKHFGDHEVVDYTSAFGAGFFASYVGNPANVALTRWQSGLTVNIFSQGMLGAMKKARAVGMFSVLYKGTKETLTETFESS